MGFKHEIVIGQIELQRVPGLHLSRSEVLGRQLQQQPKPYKHYSDDGTVFLRLDTTATRGSRTHT